MGLVSLLFSFRGRINRLQYWAGSLAVGVGSALLVFLLAVVAGAGAPMDKHAGLQGAVTLLFIVGIVGLISGWCGLALQTKRFHDRGQPGWLSALPLLPAFGMVASVVSGAASGQTPADFSAAVQPFGLAFWAINLFFFINLGCLTGTDGPNKYGDPPRWWGGGGSTPSPNTPPPQAPKSKDNAMPAFLSSSSLGGAVSAMDRAIAEAPRAMQPAPVTAPAMARAAAPASASFGRAPTSGGGFGKKR